MPVLTNLVEIVVDVEIQVIYVVDPVITSFQWSDRTSMIFTRIGIYDARFHSVFKLGYRVFTDSIQSPDEPAAEHNINVFLEKIVRVKTPSEGNHLMANRLKI